MATLNRARLKKIADKSADDLRKSMERIKIKKVKNAEELDERDVSEEKVALARRDYDAAKKRFEESKESMKDILNNITKAREEKNEEKILGNSKIYVIRA